MKSHELLYIVGRNGALAPQRTMLISQTPRTHIPISVSITAGTATVEILGRNTEDDGWVALVEVDETDAPLVQWMPQMAAQLTAATGATVRVSLPTNGDELFSS